MKKNLLSLNDYTPGEILSIIEDAKRLKRERKSVATRMRKNLAGKSIAMIFEKPSLRTRVTFEVAMNELGGSCIYLAPQNIQLGKRESVEDIARNLERWVHGVVARTFRQETLEEMAKYAGIPVINALSDLYHPCQALAFCLTLTEHRKKIAGAHVVYVGDGNNVCHSLMILCAKLGLDFTVTHPRGYGPEQAVIRNVKSYCAQSGSGLNLNHDPLRAVAAADVIYTDTWTSMGQEKEWEKRKKIFGKFQVNETLLKKAPNGCLVSHCLPAHRGLEITDSVLEGSMAFDEAENRLHVQKAVLLRLLGEKSR